MKISRFDRKLELQRPHEQQKLNLRPNDLSKMWLSVSKRWIEQHTLNTIEIKRATTLNNIHFSFIRRCKKKREI